MHREGSVIANLLDSGPDVLLRTDAPLQLADRIALTEFARAHALPRIAWAQGTDDPEPVAILRPPTTSLAGVTITPPPGAFLQASASGEAAIVAAVLDALPSKGRIAELFAGCGTITFALAERARVAAWEGDAASASALRTAANKAGLAGRIEVMQRDLARQPLQAKELSSFAAVVLDPPFAGAAAQAIQIAAAKVPVVIYVGCNPATLSRDARPLRQAGYRLKIAHADRSVPLVGAAGKRLRVHVGVRGWVAKVSRSLTADRCSDNTPANASGFRSVRSTLQMRQFDAVLLACRAGDAQRAAPSSNCDTQMS